MWMESHHMFQQALWSAAERKSQAWNRSNASHLSCGYRNIHVDFLKSPSLLISGSGGGPVRFGKKILSSTCGQVYKTCSLNSDQKRNSNIKQTNKQTKKRFLRISHFPANKKTAEKTLTWFLMSNRKIKNRCDREFQFPFLILIRTPLRLLLQALRMCGLHPRNTGKPRENVITSARITCLCFSIVSKHLKTLVSARKHSEDFGCLFR